MGETTRQPEQATARELHPAAELADAQVMDILENMSDALFVVDQDWNITFINRKWEQFWNTRRDELLGKSIWDIYPHVVGTAVYDKLLEVMHARRELRLEFFSEYTQRWLDLRAYPSGAGIVSYFTDITDRKQSELLLWESQQRTESILSSVADTHLIIDRDWRYVYVNTAGEKTIGLPRDQIIGRSVWELYPDVVGTEIERLQRRAMYERVPIAFENHYPRKDTWWENRFYPVPEGLAIFATNITKRKHAELERARLLEQLQHLSRQLLRSQEVERRAMAGDLHDEIGQQLAGLALLLGTVDQRLPREDFEKRMTTAQGHLQALIERTRNLALDLRPAALDDFGLVPAFAALFEGFTAQVQIRVLFDHTGILARRFAPEVETSVYRIVEEALANVARHAQVDAVSVRVQADAQALTVSIQDHGSGFDSHMVAAGASNGIGGMQERAALVGGQLSLVTAQGGGTTVSVHIPLPTTTRARPVD